MKALGLVGGTTIPSKIHAAFSAAVQMLSHPHGCKMAAASWLHSQGGVGKEKGESHHGNTSPSSSDFFLHLTGKYWVIQRT